MQNLNKQIEENKSLRAENDALKTENNKVKQRISQLDENAVRRATAQKDAVIESLNTQLVSKTRTLQQYSMGEIQNFGSSMERLDKAA